MFEELWTYHLHIYRPLFKQNHILITLRYFVLHYYTAVLIVNIIKGAFIMFIAANIYYIIESHSYSSHTVYSTHA